MLVRLRILTLWVAYLFLIYHIDYVLFKIQQSIELESSAIVVNIGDRLCSSPFPDFDVYIYLKKAKKKRNITHVKPPGPCLNINTTFSGYRGFQYKDATMVIPSYLKPYTGKTVILYWDPPPPPPPPPGLGWHITQANIENAPCSGFCYTLLNSV